MDIGSGIPAFGPSSVGSSFNNVGGSAPAGEQFLTQEVQRQTQTGRTSRTPSSRSREGGSYTKGSPRGR